MKKIRIGIAEDQVLFRKGICSILNVQPNFELLFDAGDGEQLLGLLAGGNVPDVLLLDLRMPGVDGIEVTRIVKEKYPSIAILVLSAYDEDRFVIRMVELGVSGYLDKNADPGEVISAINAVSKNDFYFNSKSVAAIKRGIKGGKHKVSFSNPDNLTERELEVLKLICYEKTAAEIGAELFLSTRTVEGHRNNLLLKTGARNIAGLVMYAMRNELI